MDYKAEKLKQYNNKEYKVKEGITVRKYDCECPVCHNCQGRRSKNWKENRKNQYRRKAMVKAAIDIEACRACGQCVDICMNDAIVKDYIGQSKRKVYKVIDEKCAGCGVCEDCPYNAIGLVDNDKQK